MFKHALGLSLLIILFAVSPARAEGGLNLNDLYAGGNDPVRENASAPQSTEPDTFVEPDPESGISWSQTPAGAPTAKVSGSDSAPGSVLNGTQGQKDLHELMNSRVNDAPRAQAPAAQSLGSGDRDLKQRMDNVGRH